MSVASSRGLLAALLVAVSVVVSAADPAAIDAARQQAVAAARDGRLDQAILSLRRLQTVSADRNIVFDLVVVLTWAGQPDEAIRIYEGQGLAADAPEYVAAAIARAYRADRRFVEAERMARAALQRRPGDAGWTVLLALVLADLGRTAEAEILLQDLTTREPEHVEAWRARGYVGTLQNDPYQALRGYGEANRLQPGNAETEQGLARTLQDLGGPFAAGATGQSTRQSLAPFDMRVRQAGSRVRWGAKIVSEQAAERFAGTDVALADLDALIAEATAATPVDAPSLRVLQRDRVVALRNRERWTESLAAISALRAAGDTIPAYVRMAEADALLAVRRPKEARRAYQDVIDADPREREARIGRFYAEVEDEDFAAAFATVDALAAEGEPRKHTPARSSPEPNGDWLDAQILAANARNYADMNAEAWSRINPLADNAPGLGYLRSARGGVAAARGWPRLAEQEVYIAASLAPEDRGIEVALADSDLRRRDLASARRRAASLSARFPNDPAVQRLERDLARFDKAEFHFDVSSRREYGSATAAPGGGLQSAVRLYSSPMGERWRAVAALRDTSAEPVEGRVTRRSLGAGAEYAGPDLTVEALAWDNSGTLSKSGASVTSVWHADDHWAVYAGVEAFASSTPMRALFYGITSNAIDLGGEYRWHESRALAASVRASRFSDGNERQAQILVFSQRIVDRPHFDVTLRPEYYASRNSLIGAPYFNPMQDRSVGITIDAEHVISRFYERSWTQRLAVTGASYWQQNYGSGPVGALLYEQRYQFDPNFEVRYGAEVNRRIYDGARERALIGFFRLDKRF